MRIYATVNDRTARRSFRERKHRKRPLTVLDHTLPAFGFNIAADETRTYFVRVVRKLGAVNIVLGKTTELTADEARGKAVAEIEAAQSERKTGPLMRDFADEFIRRAPIAGSRPLERAIFICSGAPSSPVSEGRGSRRSTTPTCSGGSIP